MEDIAIIVLAAGKGTRMAALNGAEALPKVLSRTLESTLIEHVLSTATQLGPSRLVIVTGFQAAKVEDCVRNMAKADPKLVPGFARQAEQLGTGDAVRAAEERLKGFVGSVLILSGDVPLVKTETLRALITEHHRSKATITVLTLVSDSPIGSGRMVRSKDGALEKIVEQRDASAVEQRVTEINTGIYVVDSAFLFPALAQLKNDNSQGEYYLTDIVATAVSEGQTVATLTTFDPGEVQGVNSPSDLALVNSALNTRLVQKLIEGGVVVRDPNSLFVEPGVQVAPGVVIGPQVQLLGNTSIAKGVEIEGGAYITNCQIAEDAKIKFSVRCEDAQIGERASVGPFAHLRPGTVLGSEVKVGNFVEIKKSKLSAGAKVSHLSYIGDATVGEEANIGAGTITCNYDGYSKFETVIERDAFIGSNSSLVAPVTIGAGAVVGAGSVITKDVTKDALAVTRAPQIEIAEWAKRRRELMKMKGS